MLLASSSVISSVINGLRVHTSTRPHAQGCCARPRDHALWRARSEHENAWGGVPADPHLYGRNRAMCADVPLTMEAASEAR
eukprot:scaffold2577_cov570-Prasinococcus_capsulatus_cf.AAC.1